MRILIINRSDLRGGAAVASMRLLEAMRAQGEDARMLTAEKLSDSPFVELWQPTRRVKTAFLADRLGIFFNNGLSRRNLFAVDSASVGLPLHRHPLVREADAILLGWTNQGMLSLRETERIAALGKPVIQTMHDMWCATGICHHAATCRRFETRCESCPLLGACAPRRGKADLSTRTQRRKAALYSQGRIRFVAVSEWLRRKCAASSLLRGLPVEVIPNPLPVGKLCALPLRKADLASGAPIEAVMAAARLDETVKGLDILAGALRILADKEPALASRLHITFCGSLRDPDALRDIPVSHTHTGTVSADDLAGILSRSHLLLSPSRYESWGYTLAEGQACGALPVAFRSGGQEDIISPSDAFSGSLAAFDGPDDKLYHSYASALSEGLKTLLRAIPEKLHTHLRESAGRFSGEKVACAYLNLIGRMRSATDTNR